MRWRWHEPRRKVGKRSGSIFVQSNAMKLTSIRPIFTATIPRTHSAVVTGAARYFIVWLALHCANGTGLRLANYCIHVPPAFVLSAGDPRQSGDAFLAWKYPPLQYFCLQILETPGRSWI